MPATIQTIEKPTKARALDTSGNNNHGQIYSGRALEFDGVTDYLDAGTGVDLGTGDFTISAWVYLNAIGADENLFYKKNDNNNRWYFVINSSGKLSFYSKYSGSVVISDTGDTPLEANTWYRIVVSVDRDSFIKFYINGVLDGTGSGNTDTIDNTGALVIGKNGTTGSTYVDGMMSDAQIWDAAFSAADVLYDYNNPEQLALNRGGTSLTNSNLKIWYPMNDGHRGQQSYILDASNTGVGDELIDSQTDRDFSGSNNWVLVNGSGSATMSTTGGQLVFSGSTTSDYPYLHRDYTTDFKAGDSIRYELVLSDVSGGTVKVQLDGGANIATGLTSGTNVFYHNGTSGNALKGESRIIPESSSMSFKIDSLSLKPVNDKNHATTVFTGDDLWDGADDSVTNWSAADGSTHVASADCIKLTAGSYESASNIQLRNTKDLTADLVVGRKYQASYDSAGDIVGSSQQLKAYDTSSYISASSTTTVANLISNPGFETAGGGGADIWANWIETAGSGTLANDTSNEHNGSDCASLTTVSTNTCLITQNATVTANTKYLLTYWSKSGHASNSGAIRHRVLDASDSDAVIIDSNYSGNTTTDWVQTALQFTTPADCVLAKLVFLSPSGNYEAFVDDVVISAFETNTIDFTAGHATDCTLRHMEATGADMIAAVNDRNSIFDEGASDWIAYNESGSEASLGYSFGYMDITIGTGNHEQGAQLPVANFTALQIGRHYAVRVLIDAASGTPTVKVDLGGSAAVSTATSTSGTNYYFKVTPVNTTGALRIYTDDADGIDIRIDNVTIKPCENLWVDDISLKEVGVATGWTDADQQLDIPQTALQSYNQLAWFDGYASDTAATLDSTFYFEVGQTINMWVYPNVIVANDSILGARELENYIKYFRASGSYSASNTLLQFEPENNTSYDIDADGGGTLEVGQWQMYTFIWNTDRTMDWYINGEKIADSSATADTTDGKRLKVGHFGAGYGTSAQPFEGAMTDISHYTDILTQAEINELYNDGKALDAYTHSNRTALAGYWRNNGLSEWEDLSSGTNDINVDSAETMLITAGADGSRDSQGFIMNRQRATNSLNFPDVGDVDADITDNVYVKLNTNPLVTTTISADNQPFSVSLWVKPHRTYSSAFHGIFWLGDSDTSIFGIGTENGEDLNIIYDANNASRPTVNSVLPVNEWTHVVVCCSSGADTASSSHATVLTDGNAAFDVDELINGWLHNASNAEYGTITDNTATTITCAAGGFDNDSGDNYNIVKVYINGVADPVDANNDTGTPSSTDSDGQYRIGVDDNSQRQYIGEVDDISVYDNKWLTQAEVKRNYNAGKRSHR
jgi:hypothetical protein